MVSNWRNVIHQPPGAPAWLPGVKPSHSNLPEPTLSTNRLRLPSAQGLGSLSLYTPGNHSMGADGSAHARSRTTMKDSRVWEPQPTVHIFLTANARTNSNSSGYLSLPLSAAPPVPLAWEPLENRDNVLVPGYPGTQNSSWHIARIVFISMYY